MNLADKPIVFTNTKTRKKETFRSITPGVVKMYSCGPTVYGPIHIGNLRAALTSDLFFRFFKRFGYEVNYVRNYTDIDDRIIDQVIKKNVTLEALTGSYIQEVEKDYALAQMEEPTHKVKVTDHIPEIVTMIGQIIKNGKAYVTAEGEVFFSISSFPTYGALSGKSVDDLLAGARVEVNPSKKNPLDFSLWKPAKPSEPSWDSPWGKGRPGWHIECSAMAVKWLGSKMDLHHGGEDLIFPHHENEIAQTEAATGEAPYVNCWVHNAFLNFSGVKMSKSLGNVVNARDFLAEYGAEITRMLFLGVHYRTPFDVSEEAMDQAISGLERIYEAKKIAESILTKKIAVPDLMAEQGWGSFLIDCERASDAIADQFANDLNTPGALSQLFSLIREWNRHIVAPNAQNTPAAILAAREFTKVIELDIGAVLGIGKRTSEQMLSQLAAVKVKRQQNSGKTVLEAAEIEKLLVERKEVRIAKNFKRSDEIRDLLMAAGVEIKDSPAGTSWTRK